MELEWSTRVYKTKTGVPLHLILDVLTVLLVAVLDQNETFNVYFVPFNRSQFTLTSTTNSFITFFNTRLLALYMFFE